MIPLLIFLMFNFFLSLDNVPLRNFSTIVYFYQELHINHVKKLKKKNPFLKSLNQELHFHISESYNS
jgi:hypothetical protein